MLFKSPIIGTQHLLLSILRDENSVSCSVLNKYGILYENVKDEYEAMREEQINPRAEFPGGQEEERSRTKIELLNQLVPQNGASAGIEIHNKGHPQEHIVRVGHD